MIEGEVCPVEDLATDNQVCKDLNDFRCVQIIKKTADDNEPIKILAHKLGFYLDINLYANAQAIWHNYCNKIRERATKNE